MRLTRKTLRKMIIREMADIGGQTAQKVVELAMSDAFYLRHPELQGGEIVVDEMDEVAGALVALKGVGFTHVNSLESGVTEPIEATIHYFDEFEGRYTEHYGDVRQEEPMSDMGFGDSYDEDSDDDDFI